MNRLAIFCEGQTEQIFCEKLLLEFAGGKNLRIEKRRAKGGARSKRRIRLLEATAPDSAEEYFVMIVDCGEDERVKSDIVERYDNLVKTGYQQIIGIRDVYPQKREDIPKLREGLRYRVKTLPIAVLFVLAVMEIEAWFIAEHSHFMRISDQLTIERIRTDIGFDPSTDDIELRDHPSEDLDSIYRLGGFAYKKSKNDVQRTVNVLDYAGIYLELGHRLKLGGLQNLLDSIDLFLSSE